MRTALSEMLFFSCPIRSELQKSLVHRRQDQVFEKHSICFKSTLSPLRQLDVGTSKNSCTSTEAKCAARNISICFDVATLH